MLITLYCDMIFLTQKLNLYNKRYNNITKKWNNKMKMKWNKKCTISPLGKHFHYRYYTAYYLQLQCDSIHKYKALSKSHSQCIWNHHSTWYMPHARLSLTGMVCIALPPPKVSMKLVLVEVQGYRSQWKGGYKTLRLELESLSWSSSRKKNIS